MRFLKRKTVWSTSELGLVKTAMVSMGITIGSYFNKFIEDFTSFFFIVFIVSAILSVFLWIEKLRKY